MSMFTREQLYASNGSARIKSLFFELVRSPDNIMTLKDYDHEGYPSIKRLYIEHTVNDPSEATFAEEVFGDIGFWLRLKESSYIRSRIDGWKQEAEIKRKSKAFQSIIKEVEEDGRNSYQAAKFLIDQPWLGSGKAAKRKNADTTKEAAGRTNADAARIAQIVEFRKTK